MITTGAKFYFGLAALAVAGAVVYSWGSHGGFTGGITFGFYGGMGEHAGYVVLLSAALVALFVGGAVIAFRDADPEAQQAVGGVDHLPETHAPRDASYWPVIGAVAAACTVLGLVTSNLLFLFGVILGIVVLLEWMVAAWSERATGDPEVNRRIRNRVMNPIEIPLFGAIGVAVLVLCVSRVLLAVSETGAAIIAVVVAVLILASASIYATAPKAGRTIVAAVCVLGVLGVLAGGIIGAAEGSRNFEAHEGEQHTTPPDRRQPATPTTEEAPAASETPTTAEAN
ncbi:MAG: hypothetical protein QOD92_4049 [Acidimicrobiaceae bacterium]|jgi:hypothetical protein